MGFTIPPLVPAVAATTALENPLPTQATVPVGPSKGFSAVTTMELASPPTASYASALFAGDTTAGSGSPPSRTPPNLVGIYEAGMESLQGVAPEQRTERLRAFLTERFENIADEDIAAGLPDMMEPASYEGEAAEVFFVAASRGIPEAFEILFELQMRLRDGARSETWRVPFEDAASRCDHMLHFEVDRSWLYPRVEAGDLGGTQALKRLVLFQDRPFCIDNADYSETDAEMMEARAVWLTIARLTQDPESACARLREILLTPPTPHALKIGLSLLTARARQPFHIPYAKLAADVLAWLIMNKVSDAFPALLSCLKRTVPHELMDHLRFVAASGLHTEALAEMLFGEAWDKFQRALQSGKDFSKRPFEEKIGICYPWLRLLEELSVEHVPMRQRLDLLRTMVRSSGSPAN